MASSSARYDSTLVTLQTAAENGGVSQADAEAIRRLTAAYDPEDATEDLPTDLYEGAARRKDGHKSYETLEAWTQRLTVAARSLDLTSATARDINAWTTGLVKDDDGPGRARVNSIEYSLKKFYRFHDLEVDPGDITVHARDRDAEGWDARDLLDADERLAMRTVAEHPRDLAVYHLLIYTGMRNTALRTLRVGDIDLENHEWYFNTDADGLKDVYDPREPRPLFQAERAVRDWLEYHPTGRDEDYFVTGKPKYSVVDATKPVSRETVRRTMQNIKKRTAERDGVLTVEKPCHPHMMRHNFVSMCLRHPDISDGDIKFYLGHAPGSDVMETTYGHLSSEDHNQSGHGAFGVAAAADNGDDLDPWDTTCPHCDRVLHPTEDTCESCGTPRGPTPWAPGVANEPDPTARLLNSALVDGDAEALDTLAEAVAGHLSPEKLEQIAAVNANALDGIE